MKIVALVLLFGAAASFIPAPRLIQKTRLHAGLFDNLFQANKPASPSTRTPQAKPATAVKQQQQKTKKKSPEMSWVDRMISNPVHGRGSADESDLDAMWKAQQQLLQERRSHFQTKDLRKKYADAAKDHHNEIRVAPDTMKMKNQKEDDAMWIDESAPNFEFPNPFKNLKP